MTPLERQAARALGRCVFLPGTGPKRFAQAMSNVARTQPDYELTEKQATYLWTLVKMYRKQLPHGWNEVAEQMIADPSRPASEIVVTSQLKLPL